MQYYAANNQVSTDPIEGGIQITAEQYADAIAGVCEGKVISVDGGFKIAEPPEPEPEIQEPEPVDPNAPYIIAKSTPWLRMTDEEAELITGAMQQAGARLKGIYDAVTYLNSADPLWATLYDMLATTLSPARADELLARET